MCINHFGINKRTSTLKINGIFDQSKDLNPIDRLEVYLRYFSHFRSDIYKC